MSSFNKRFDDFDKQFKKRSDEFDRDSKRIQKWGFIASIFGAVISLGLLGFFIWVILQVMQYIGII